jgi:hypothetical protein
MLLFHTFAVVQGVSQILACVRVHWFDPAGQKAVPAQVEVLFSGEFTYMQLPVVVALPPTSKYNWPQAPSPTGLMAPGSKYVRPVIPNRL